MNKYLKIPLILFILLLVNCSDKKEEEEKKYDLEKQLKDSKEKELISIIKKRYDIGFKWDTIRLKYSNDFNPTIETKNQLIEKFTILDFYNKDSLEYISICAGNRKGYKYDKVPYYIFDFVINKVQKETINKHYTPSFRNGNNKGIKLVVFINKINKIKLKIVTDSDDEKETVSNSLENPNGFIGFGKIIDIIESYK